MTSSQSDFYGEEDPEFTSALLEVPLDSTPTAKNISRKRSRSPNSPILKNKRARLESSPKAEESDNDEAVVINLSQVIQPNQGLQPDDDDVYGAAHYGGFGEYMRRKRAKLQIQNAAEQPVISQIFKGLELHVNGYTIPSVQVLREMITSHGGIFHPYLDKKSLVTHIIATNLTPAKVKEFKHMKVVRPEWIVESVKEKKLLPWQNYILIVGPQRVDAAQGKRGSQRNLFETTQLMKKSQVSLPSSSSPAKVPTQPTSSISNTPIPIAATPAGQALLEEEQSIEDHIYVTDPVTLEQAKRVPGYALNKSNEAAQRLMEQGGWREAHTAASGGDFINNFYNHSRLHHLSAWKAELKTVVAKAQEKVENESIKGNAQVPHIIQTLQEHAASPDKKGKGKGRAMADSVDKVIMHCDFDSFFVSAGLIGRPHLRGKPTVVCHSQGKGEGVASTSEIASCSYEARTTGVKNGMSLGQARQLCPDVITLPYEFERYKEISLKFYTTLLSYADDLQAVSVDEALIDVSNAVAGYRTECLVRDASRAMEDFAKSFADKLRKEITEETQCPLSIGIGSNILLARFATKQAKPAGSFHLLDEKAEEFLAPLPFEFVWGVGYSMKRKAKEQLGIVTIGDLYSKTKATLTDTFGPKVGDTLWKAARGKSDLKIESSKERKSVSAEINFGIRFKNDEEAEKFILDLSKEVSKRLNDINMRGRTLTLKIMKRHPDAPVEAPKFLGHGICESFNRTSSLDTFTPKSAATSDPQIIGEQAWKLLQSLKFDPTELRGIGLQVTRLELVTDGDAKLEGGQQRLLFGVPSSSKNPYPSKSDDATYQPPTADDIDLTVLQELPEDLRREIEESMKTPVKPSIPPVTPIRKSEEHDGHELITSEDEISIIERTPTKKTTPNVNHITRQLRPKVRTIITPSKNSVFNASMKSKVSVSNKEMTELGIDAEVFGLLPVDVQKEQLLILREARIKQQREKGRRSVSVFGGGESDNDRAFSRRPTRSPSIPAVELNRHFEDTLHHHVPLVAHFVEQPAVVQKKRGSTEIIRLVEVNEIQNHVKKWVIGSEKTQSGPRKADVEGLQTWLVQSITNNQSLAPGVGLEKVVTVMKWWRVLLRNHWKELESIAVEESSEKRANAGALWWSAFRGVKGVIDRTLKEHKLGGRLSLR